MLPAPGFATFSIFFGINNLNFLIIYILGILFTAVFTEGFFFSFGLSLVSVLGYNFFFTAPRYTFNVIDRSYLVTFLLMLAVGLAISSITFELKKRMSQVADLKVEKVKLKNDAEKEQIKTTLLQSASHDLRTPLTTIKNGAQALRDNPSLSAEQRQLILSDIALKSDWTIRLVENLLSLTRINSNTLTVRKRDEALEEVIPQAVATVRSDLGHRTIHYEMPPEMLIVPMDATLISQVIVNILTNAIKHTKDDGNIWIKAWNAGNKAVFRLSNDGEPLDAKTLPRLFEMYYSTPDKEGENSTGLGLAVCKLIVTAHGGTIEAHNVDGRVVFEFTLKMGEPDNG